MLKEESKKEIDLSDIAETYQEKAREQAFSPGVYFPTVKKIIRYLKKTAKDRQKISYLILGFFIVSIITICFLLYSALKPPAIPKEALENPERGLLIED